MKARPPVAIRHAGCGGALKKGRKGVWTCAACGDAVDVGENRTALLVPSGVKKRDRANRPDPEEDR